MPVILYNVHYGTDLCSLFMLKGNTDNTREMKEFFLEVEIF